MCDERKESSISTRPRTNKLFKWRLKNRWVKWLFPITGLIATIWFLIRVLPKPSRATYPCQRVAFPLASSFIAYILGLLGTAVALRKARQRLHQSRYVLAGICIFVGLASAWLTISIDSRQAAAATFYPPDPCNSPMGVAKGINPGRVVWVHDPNATDWNGSDNYYWDDNHIDANVVEQMMSNSVRWLTGKPTNASAWDALFIHFNENHGKGSVGYSSGEKIAIKPNNVEQRCLDDEDNFIDLSPQILPALLKQLVWEAGVDESAITICDSSRYISNKAFERCYPLFPDVNYLVTNFTDSYHDANDIFTDPNRPPVECTAANVVFGSDGVEDSNLPRPFVDADYVINLAITKCHGMGGVTLTAKNWYGCLCKRPSPYHDNLARGTPNYEQYRYLVDLMGHEHLGGKTMLFILDGLWGSQDATKVEPEKWDMSPFNTDWPSSIFMSQDHVAIDSVILDFLRTEFEGRMGEYNIGDAIDDYLHEAALANDPCSGIFYDPNHNGDVTRLDSLGVHEHWNNATDKEYTRNLDTGDGIELVTCTDSPDGDVDGDCQVNYLDLRQMKLEWLTSGNLANLDDTGNVNMKDFAILANDWCGCNLSPQGACQ